MFLTVKLSKKYFIDSSDLVELQKKYEFIFFDSSDLVELQKNMNSFFLKFHFEVIFYHFRLTNASKLVRFFVFEDIKPIFFRAARAQTTCYFVRLHSRDRADFFRRGGGGGRPKGADFF